MTALTLTCSPAPELAVDLARLSDALRIHDAGFIAFALYDTDPTRDSLIRELVLRLAGQIEIRQIMLTPGEPYLQEKLCRSSDGGRVAYFAYGFEEISGEARDQAFGALQIQREAMARMGVPIVLWMVAGNLTDLARRAPDVFAWRGGLYDFRSLESNQQRAKEFSSAHPCYNPAQRASARVPQSLPQVAGQKAQGQNRGQTEKRWTSRARQGGR